MLHVDPKLDVDRSGGTPRGCTLVLGGGGSRGLAHLGVIRELEEAGVPIRAIVGNSAGAIMGAAWIQAGGARPAIERVLEFLRSRAFRRLGLSQAVQATNGHGPDSMLSRILSGWRRHVAMHLLFRRPSLFHRRRLESLVRAAVDGGDFASLARPLLAVALDLRDGSEVVLDAGDLCEALVASASAAGFFPPVEVGGRTLIDSGLSDNLPVGVAIERCGRPVVAVNLSHDVDERGAWPTGIEILLRSEELGSRFNNGARARLADAVIAPRLGGRYWLDFSGPESIIESGAAAARAALAELARIGLCPPPPAPAAATIDRPTRPG